MSVPTADTTPRASGPRPAAGVWIAAAAEVIVAIACGSVLLHYGNASSPGTHPMPDMAGVRSHHYAPEVHWTAGAIALAAFTVAALIWWAASRAPIAAGLAALGLIGVATSEPVRFISLQSHLVAMAALEALMVAAPLLLIAALWRKQGPIDVQRSGAWMAGVVVAVVLNSALLIALHLPGIHGRGAGLTAVPLWLTGVAVFVGLNFWAAILLTGRHVEPSARRHALIVGQEVAVILGLAALFVPSPYMHQANALGLSPVTDQRLGGALMVLTCAAVTLPLARRLQKQQVAQRLRTESHVH